MALCPSCNKFCSLDLGDPELNDSGVDKIDETEKGVSIRVHGSIRIVRSSECCGDEIKEANFDFEEDFEVAGHKGEEGHEFEIDDGDLEATEEGGSRYKKAYYGVSWSPEISCSCGEEVKLVAEEGKEPGTIEFSDKVAASEMDELV